MAKGNNDGTSSERVNHTNYKYAWKLASTGLEAQFAKSMYVALKAGAKLEL